MVPRPRSELNPMLTIYGIFLALHGLVHFWPATLSWRLVEFRPEMGWTGASFVLSRFLSESTVLTLAGVLFPIAAIVFVVSGIGVAQHADWARWLLTVSAVFSSLVLVLYWDGSAQMLVQKGLIGLVINVLVMGGLARQIP